MIRYCIETISFDARAHRSRGLYSLTRLLNRIALWQERARSRRALQQLDDRMLRDVALSRSDVERECGKFFWQI